MAPSQFGWIAGSEVIGGGAEVVRVSHNAILVSRMHLATIVLLCKQTTDNFRTRNPPEPRWRHLSGNRILFVPHSDAKGVASQEGFYCIFDAIVTGATSLRYMYKVAGNARNG